MTTTPNESAALALLQQWLACYRAKDVEGILARAKVCAALGMKLVARVV